MPDILIRGIEMPTGCASCDFAIYHADSAYHYCFWLKQVFVKPDARLKDCPLHELPEHGDLIDKQATFKALSEKFKSSDGFVSWTDAIDIVLRAPVVISADKEETE